MHGMVGQEEEEEEEAEDGGPTATTQPQDSNKTDVWFKKVDVDQVRGRQLLTQLSSFGFVFHFSTGFWYYLDSVPQ